MSRRFVGNYLQSFLEIRPEELGMEHSDDYRLSSIYSTFDSTSDEYYTLVVTVPKKKSYMPVVIHHLSFNLSMQYVNAIHRQEVVIEREHQRLKYSLAWPENCGDRLKAGNNVIVLGCT